MVGGVIPGMGGRREGGREVYLPYPPWAIHPCICLPTIHHPGYTMLTAAVDVRAASTLTAKRCRMTTLWAQDGITHGWEALCAELFPRVLLMRSLLCAELLRSS